jgi:carbohydrate diacid regulator
VVDSIVRVIVNQYYSLRSLAEVDQRADYLAYDYLVAGLIKGHEYFAMAEGTGLRRRMNLCAILLEISDPNYTLQNKREVKEGERYEIINRTRRNIEDTFHNFYTKHPFARANYLGGQRFLVWKDMGSNAADYIDDFKRTLPNLHYNLQDALRTQISMGVGSYKVGAEHMRESYQEAEMAVRFGKQNSGPNKVYSHDDLWAIAPIYSEASDSNLNFNDKVIKTIKEQAGLLKTLEKFVDNELSLTKTAKELHIHRNTLVYRLDKIYEITNLDPKIFNDAFELKIALIMERRRVH